MARRRETPAEWLPLLEAAGIHSARDLATKTGLAITTVTRLMHEGTSTDETRAAVAAALRVKVDKILAITGTSTHGEFVLPDDAHRLSPKQRNAVLAVVRAMLEPDEAAVRPVSPKGQRSPTTGAAEPDRLLELAHVARKRPGPRKRQR